MLTSAGVTDDSTLYSLLRLLGGGKKRKKKTYTKPKKQKHKHKKIKCRILKYYKVSQGTSWCMGLSKAVNGCIDQFDCWTIFPQHPRIA